MKKVLIIGKTGQLAWELQRTVPKDVAVTVLGQSDLDITDGSAVNAALNACNPSVVINAAAYTAVDKAETEADAAFSVNRNGAANLAKACAQFGVRLLHVSTDFVFDGNISTPYAPDATPHPESVYGHSKLEGEAAVLNALPNAVIVRTAWVYSSHGNNFVKTMLRLMGSVPQLKVVYDQVGTPTWAFGLAEWLWAVVHKPSVDGLYHWTDAGVASWYDFAVAIQELAVQKGLLESAIPVLPIPTSGYPLPAKRPAYSVLDKTTAEQAANTSTVHWRKQLSAMLDEIKNSKAN